MSFYDPTNSHTYFGQKIFTIRWIATVVLLGGFDFTSAFILRIIIFICLPDCYCDKDNSLSIACNDMGKCECKTGFGGDKCDECYDGYTGPNCDQCNTGYYKPVGSSDCLGN